MMNGFLKKPKKKIINFINKQFNSSFINNKMPQELLLQKFPHFVLEILSQYFRLEIEGKENFPMRGAAILTPNHSGFAGLDAMILIHWIYKYSHRVPRVLTHPFWFFNSWTANTAKKMGFVKASLENGSRALKKNNLLLIFPEGESGNFKPSDKMYQLQKFRNGFVKLAIQNQVPIVPILIFGAEETNLTLTHIKFRRILKGTLIPIPANIIPLPVKWKIKILPPIHLPYMPEHANDEDLLQEICEDIQESMQKQLLEELKTKKIF